MNFNDIYEIYSYVIDFKHFRDPPQPEKNAIVLCFQKSNFPGKSKQTIAHPGIAGPY